MQRCFHIINPQWNRDLTAAEAFVFLTLYNPRLRKEGWLSHGADNSTAAANGGKKRIRCDYLSELVSHEEGRSVGFGLHVRHVGCCLWVDMVRWKHLT